MAELGLEGGEELAGTTTILIQDEYGGQQAIQLDAETAASMGIDLEAVERACAEGDGAIAEISEEGINRLHSQLSPLLLRRRQGCLRLMQATRDGTLVAEPLTAEGSVSVEDAAPPPPAGLPPDLRTVEFNFLDNKSHLPLRLLFQREL